MGQQEKLQEPVVPSLADRGALFERPGHPAGPVRTSRWLGLGDFCAYIAVSASIRRQARRSAPLGPGLPVLSLHWQELLTDLGTCLRSVVGSGGQRLKSHERLLFSGLCVHARARQQWTKGGHCRRSAALHQQRDRAWTSCCVLLLRPLSP